MKFYKCEHCGNLVAVLHDSGVPMICCGEPMKELVAGATDGAQEKHVPVVEREGNLVKVCVGSVLHPMLEEHHIAWVYLETTHGGQFRYPAVGRDPIVTFALAEGEEPVAAYEYCNLHGLWKKEL